MGTPLPTRAGSSTTQRGVVQEKEMTAVVHCLRTWRHYLLGAKFVVMTDNVAISYFQSQKKLSPKQVRWQDFLAEFDMVLEYKPGRTNQVADALSRKAELVASMQQGKAISHPKGAIQDLIREGLEKDPTARCLMEMV